MNLSDNVNRDSAQVCRFVVGLSMMCYTEGAED